MPPGTGAVLIVECDGTQAAVDEEIDRVARRLPRGGRDARVAARPNDDERDRLWNVRRQLSLALRATGLLKINHDVVVPRGRVPELFDVDRRAAARRTGCASPRSVTPATATSTST